MAQKGVVWLLVGVAIIFLVEVLVLSLMFTRITTFTREVKDSNLLFEGDELETYVQSIRSAVELSVAQSIYDFYLTHNGGVWQNYGEFLVPDSAIELAAKARQYTQSFLDAHREFPGATDSPAIEIFPKEDLKNPILVVNQNDVSARFSEEFELRKNFPGVAQYSRKFVAEAKLITVFGKMMDRARALVVSDEVGSQVKNAIGYESYSPDANEPGSYLNNFASGGFSFVSGQLTSGTVEYCDTSGDPGPWEVYEDTHGNSRGGAEDRIESLIQEHLMSYYQLRMDQESTEYTTAFDGISTESEITASCAAPETLRNCNCRCTARNELGVCIATTCDRYKRMTCEYQHTGMADLTVRMQEDGFVYGFWDGGKMVADNIKIVFRAISGN